MRAREVRDMGMHDMNLLDPFGGGDRLDHSQADDFEAQLAMEDTSDANTGDIEHIAAAAAAAVIGSLPTPPVSPTDMGPPAPPASNGVVPGVGEQADVAARDADADLRDELSQLLEPFDAQDADSRRRRREIPGGATSNAQFDELFDVLTESARESVAMMPDPVPDADSDSTVQRTKKIMSMVEAAHPEWPMYMRRLACAALSVYRLRLIDMFIREHVLLLWIIEGDVYLRVHNGTAYFYDDRGAFQAYKGIPPESTFGRVKKTLLALEGLFRVLPPNVDRNDAALMGAIAECVNMNPTLADFWNACADAAIFCKGDKPRAARAAAHMDVDDAIPAVGAAEAPAKWPVYTAQAISRAGFALQKELLQPATVTYISEWCEFRMSAQLGWSTKMSPCYMTSMVNPPS